jgi:hypothetical protein
MGRRMKGKFDLVEEIQNDDGTWNLIFDVDSEFQEWFKESQGLKRWSHKRFQKVLHEALVRAVERGENEMENKAIFKFNNSHRALLCSGCRVILKDGYRFSDEEMAAFQGATELEAQYCNTCEAGKEE